MFRDIPWHSEKSEAEAILIGQGAEANDASFRENILRMNGINFSNTTVGSDRVDGGGVVRRYTGLKVAGYDVSETKACYIYKLNEDGTINKDENSAEFYFGWYVFDSNDFADGPGIYDDLSTKLESLYGEGSSDESSDYFNTTTWMDAEGNVIRLLLGGKKNQENYYVTLGYMASGSEQQLDEMQTAVNNEAIALEAAEREANKNDTSGL